MDEVSSIVFDGLAKFRPDLTLALLRYLCTNCLNAERRYVIVFCAKRDAPTYRSAGWEKLADMDDTECLIADAYSAIQGRNVNPLRWNYVWSDVCEYLIDSGELHPKGIDRIVLAAFRALAPLARFLFEFRRLPSNMASPRK